MAQGPRSGPCIWAVDAALGVVSGNWKSLVLWQPGTTIRIDSLNVASGIS